MSSRVESILVLNLPELFSLPEFQTFVVSSLGKGLATWHTGGDLGEYSDVFLHVDSYGNGEFDCSEALPSGVAEILGRYLGTWSGLVRLTNLQEDSDGA